MTRSHLAAACLAAAVPHAAIAQVQPADDAKALIARIDAARGKPFASLLLEGSYSVAFAGSLDTPVMKGAYRAMFLGADRARETSQMGELGALERGLLADVAWEVDPSMGARVMTGSHDVALRRYFGILRGARPSDLYAEITPDGTFEIDGRPHMVLRMRPKAGKADTWYVDAETARVRQIDIVLPAPESADVTFDMTDAMDTKLGFTDWKDVDGVAYPHRRTLEMGPARVAFALTKVTAGTALEPAAFEPPEAVRKAKRTPPPPPVGEDGKPTYQIVERAAQPVASIRLRCKPSEISATLAVVLPEVMTHLNATGARMAGAPFSRYHGFDQDGIDLEAGIPVAKPITEKGRVRNSELPGGRVVTTWHIGPYEKLTGAHEALRAYLAANSLQAAGGPWEVYWTDPGMVPDPAKWRTQIFAPLAQ